MNNHVDIKDLSWIDRPFLFEAVFAIFGGIIVGCIGFLEQKHVGGLDVIPLKNLIIPFLVGCTLATVIAHLIKRSRRPLLRKIGIEIENAKSLSSARDSLQINLQAIIETVSDGIVTLDETGTILTFNAASQNIFGYSPDEIIGSNIRGLITEACHHEFDDCLNALKEPRATLSSNGRRELNGIRKDNSEFPIDFAVGIMDSGSQRMFVGVVRDITERNALDRIKNEFISTVSHELRTPLTSIKGSLGLIASGAVGDLPDDMKTMLKIALQNSDRLILLINDILDMEKILLGKMELQLKPTDLVELVNKAIEINEGYADEYGITFTRVRCDEGSMVLGDWDRLMQVLTNLISNAAKFSNEGGQVELSVQGHQGAIRVSVKDYGIGIPEAFRDRIFEKFAQANMTNSRQKGGSGLGLNISKALIEKHGGTLDFDSEVDTGSTFYFTLPSLP